MSVRNKGLLSTYDLSMTNEGSFEQQPDELGDLKKVLKEFIDRRATILNEIETLKDDLKALTEEYKSKLDTKTLDAALKVLKIESNVKHKDTYDVMIEALKDPTV